MFRKKQNENSKLTPVATVEMPDLKSTDIPHKNGSRFARLVVAATFFDNAIVPIDIVPTDKCAQEKQTTLGFGS